ncbi:MAG: hypothetical protein K2M55_04840, partial [Muribaculaceae bacterium]|nr:hypothetical protein [Muribaculaceae bacterium]
LTEPRLYVHNRPLSVYDLLAPGDVITIENPYQFEFGGEEISWHNPVEHTVTVGGDVVPESVEYEPWSGNWIVTIPSTVGDAPSTNQPGPAGVRARAFNFYPISITSTLTPKDEHTNAFAAGEPHTYSFNVDPGQQTGVEEISADELGDAEIFTLSGVRMTGHDNLAPGFYIIVRGTSTEKVLIK